jgi:O-antigen ligase
LCGLSYPAFSAWIFSLLILAGVLVRGRVGRARWAVDATMLLAAVSIVLAKSRTPAAAFAVAVASYLAILWPLRRTLVVAVAAGCVLCFGLLVAEIYSGNSMDTVANLANLGRETESISNLTGRTEVWRALLPYIQARPWHGYGYESFWTPPRLQEFGASQGWAVPDAHNGFINLTLGLGLIGAALYSLILLLAMGRSLGRYFRGHSPDEAFACAALVLHTVNILSVATQMAPYLTSFVAMALIARLAFLEEPASPEDTACSSKACATVNLPGLPPGDQGQASPSTSR